MVRFAPCREIAFRIEENWAVWSFQLEEIDHDTTVLTQRRETPDGISDLSLELTEAFMGGTEVFTETMRARMRQTLAGIRATALAGSTDAV